MQVYASALNLTSELRKWSFLKVQYFFMKIHSSALNLTYKLGNKCAFLLVASSIYYIFKDATRWGLKLPKRLHGFTKVHYLKASF